MGAGSVVTHDIPENSVAAGNLSRVIASTSEFIEKHKKDLPGFRDAYWAMYKRIRQPTQKAKNYDKYF